MESKEEICARTRRRICAAKNRRAKSWQDVFAKCDKDQSGYLDLQEFTFAVRNTLAVPENAICDYELRTLFNEMDADRSGGVNIEELMNFLTQGFRTPEQIQARQLVRINRVRKNLKTAFQSLAHNEMSIRKLFSKLDFDGDKTLSMYEFKAFVRSDLKLNFWDICNTDIEDFFKYLDRDGGGAIDVEELLSFVKTNHSDRPSKFSFVQDAPPSSFTSMKKKNKKTYKQLLLEDSFRSASLPNLSRLPYTSSVVSLGRDYAPTTRSSLQLSAKMFFTPEKLGQ
mmetsp:Transcript_13424/g.22087  ORF Transcript_13424/g.22087 Transcript_13424/m.22087 type:complete len:283 (+) Transcript_13424:109-957(+)|eukprot:CAMPEP_0169108792 /NCGR_PEP_ID=MMETSP1015-20121227/25617_1 /TAXON_ID=342587 /ORGANISM="Karlodinium micrum, Strain CCMP2283" /LENGTH=282 /DNA_ID=CAMNT_0009170439 /DNA_START=109 /DNA_END=957 /DNA_ORIENTATION=+